MPDFQPVRPFDIDDGQLSHCTPQQCFVLGYELAQIDALIESGVSFEKVVHCDNARRIGAELRKLNRTYQWRWPHDDISESWIYLSVDGI